MNNYGYGFIPFCEKEYERILRAICRFSGNIPPKMNEPDYRFNINNLCCHSLSKEFNLGGEGGVLRSSYKPGYDMIFADITKISVKIQEEIFQRENSLLKNGTLTKPKDLVMKNCLGENRKNKGDLDLDYLMAIQRGNDKNGKRLIGFGVLSKEKLIPIIDAREMNSNSGDQIKAKINNDEWDYFSGLYEVETDNSSDRRANLNLVFSKALSEMYDEILAVEGGGCSKMKPYQSSVNKVIIEKQDSIITRTEEVSLKDISIPLVNSSKLVISSKGIVAKGEIVDSKIIVKKGSQVVKSANVSCQQTIVNIRKDLITNGIIVDENGIMTFNCDYGFKSLSGAAGVILGSSVSGKEVWKKQ